MTDPAYQNESYIILSYTEACIFLERDPYSIPYITIDGEKKFRLSELRRVA